MNINDPAVDVSVVIGFKDWGEDRLFLSVESIFEAFGKYNGEVIISDYGSSAVDVATFKERVQKSGARYVRTETDGHWSRSRAINAGYSAAKGSVLIATDADMLFSPGSLGLVVDEVLNDENLAVVLQCRDLPFGYSHEEIASASIDWEELSSVSQIRPRWGMGGMFAARRERVELVGGYDNRMHTYGGEDLDFALRVRRSGCAVKWIESPRVRMFHIWHPPTIASVENEEGGKEAIQQNRDILYKDRTWKRSYSESEWDITSAPPVFHVLYHHAPDTNWQLESIRSILEQRNCSIALTVLNTSTVPLAVSQPGISQIDVTPAELSAKVAELVASSRSPFIVFIEGGAILRPDALARTAELMDVDYGGTWAPLVSVEPDTGTPQKQQHEANTETLESVVFRKIFVVSRPLLNAVPLHGSSWEDLTALVARDLELSGAAFKGGPEFIGICMTDASEKHSNSLLAWRHRGTPSDLSITGAPDLPAGTTLESFIARLLPPGILLTDVLIETPPGTDITDAVRAFPEDASWIRITDSSGSLVSLRAQLFGVSATDLERFEAEGFLIHEVVRPPSRRALSTSLLPDDPIDIALRLARETEQVSENHISGAMAFCHGVGTSVPADIVVAQKRDGVSDLIRIVESRDGAIWFWVRACHSADESYRVRDLWRAASKEIVSSGFIVAGGLPAGLEIIKKFISTGGNSIEV